MPHHPRFADAVRDRRLPARVMWMCPSTQVYSARTYPFAISAPPVLLNCRAGRANADLPVPLDSLIIGVLYRLPIWRSPLSTPALVRLWAAGLFALWRATFHNGPP